MPLSEAALQQINSALSAVAALNTGELLEYLNKRRQVVVGTNVAKGAANVSDRSFPLVSQSKPLPLTPAWGLSGENLDAR